MSSELSVMHCQEFVERVTDYLEGALPADDLARLETHLAACEKCAHCLAQLRLTRDLAGEITDEDITPAMRGDLMDAFSRWNAERS